MENQGKNKLSIKDKDLYPNWTVDANDLLLDLKFLMKDFYLLTFTETGESLKFRFINGQSFELSIKQCT